MKNEQPPHNAMNKVFWVVAIATVLILFIIQEQQQSDEIERMRQRQDSLVIKDPEPQFKKRGYNYSSGQFIEYPDKSKLDLNDLTDEEIRHLREQNPNKIIKVPGRRILNRRENFEAQMEQYIEENHDEIIEQYRD